MQYRCQARPHHKAQCYTEEIVLFCNQHTNAVHTCCKLTAQTCVIDMHCSPCQAPQVTLKSVVSTVPDLTMKSACDNDVVQVGPLVLVSKLSITYHHCATLYTTVELQANSTLPTFNAVADRPTYIPEDANATLNPQADRTCQQQSYTHQQSRACIVVVSVEHRLRNVILPTATDLLSGHRAHKLCSASNHNSL